MTLKEYVVSFDMKYSHSVHIKAKNKTEAKQKGFDKFKGTRNKQSEYNIDVEESPC